MAGQGRPPPTAVSNPLLLLDVSCARRGEDGMMGHDDVQNLICRGGKNISSAVFSLKDGRFSLGFGQMCLRPSPAPPRTHTQTQTHTTGTVFPTEMERGGSQQ